jgi:hypothetical protein
MSAADDGIPSSQQVDPLLGSSKLALALESDRYKHLLDHAPARNVVFRAESILGQGTWFTLMLDAAPVAVPN